MFTLLHGVLRMKLYIFAFNLKMCKKKQAADIPKWVLTIKWMSDSCIGYEFVIFYFQSLHAVGDFNTRTIKCWMNMKRLVN